MKAKDLIDMLGYLDPEEEVYFLPENSSYPEDFDGNVERNIEIRSFWGSDFKGTLLISDGQIGGV